MKTTNEFPTILAQTIGEKLGLLLENKSGVDYKKMNELKERMQYFQQMAITSSFADCVQVYFGLELTEEQISGLKLIHRMTKPWVTGHIVGVLMSRITSDSIQNKDFAEAVRVLVDQSQTKKEGELTQRMTGILVSSSLTEEKRKGAAE